MISVQVRGSVDQAVRNLKQLMQHNLVFQVMKRMAYYESPSERKARKKQESRRRIKKNYYRRKYDD